MNVIINGRTCQAGTGQTLGKVARLNHSHVGYVCGGHGVCQACYVTVQDGAALLSPLTDVEHAFLSPRQIAAGGRLACQATIVADGTISLLSRPEAVRQAVLGADLPTLFSIAGDMGRDTVRQIGPGVRNLAGRIASGDIKGGGSALRDLAESLGGAVGLAVEQLPAMIPFKGPMQAIADVLAELPVPSVPFLPGGSSGEPSLERVNITVGAHKKP